MGALLEKAPALRSLCDEGGHASVPGDHGAEASTQGKNEKIEGVASVEHPDGDLEGNEGSSHEAEKASFLGEGLKKMGIEGCEDLESNAGLQHCDIRQEPALESGNAEHLRNLTCYIREVCAHD
jgi:hypothetical protein